MHVRQLISLLRMQDEDAEVCIPDAIQDEGWPVVGVESRDGPVVLIVPEGERGYVLSEE